MGSSKSCSFPLERGLHVCFAEIHRVVLSLISCFAGGVFLAACLLDIIPDYLSDINAELEVRRVEVGLTRYYLHGYVL